MYYLQGPGKVPGRFLCPEAEGWHRRSTEPRICHLTKKRAGQRNAHFLQTSVWQRGSPATNEKYFFGLLLFVRWREGRHRAKNEGLLLQMRQGECDGFHFPWRCHICKPRVLPGGQNLPVRGKGYRLEALAWGISLLELSASQFFAAGQIPGPNRSIRACRNQRFA